MWYDRTIRLRPDAIKLLLYLQSNLQHLRKKELPNFILDEKLPELWDTTYLITDYTNSRKVKGIQLKKTTIENFDQYLTFHRHLLKAEVFEICLYLYAVEHLTEIEQKLFNLPSWHVRPKM